MIAPLKAETGVKSREFGFGIWRLLREHRWLIGALLVALALRLVFLLPTLERPNLAYANDARSEYVPLARDLRSGYLEPSDPLFEVGLLRPPGYPVFLAATMGSAGGNIFGPLLLQILLSVATVWLAYALARELFGATPGVLAAWFLAVDPANIPPAATLASEALFIALLAGCFLLWVRGLKEGSVWKATSSGALLGMASLVRPIGLYLSAVLLLVGRWVPRVRSGPPRHLTFLVFALAFVVPAGGWVVRNYLVADLPAISSIESANLLYYRAGGTLMEEEGPGFDVDRFDEIGARLRAEVDARVGPDADPGDRSATERTLAIQIILDHPRGASVSFVKGLVRMTVGPGRHTLLERFVGGDPSNASLFQKVVVLGFATLALLAVYLAAAIGAVALFRHGRIKEALLLVLPATYFFLISAGPGSYSRFRAPAMPFLAALAGYGVAFATARLTQRITEIRRTV